MGLSRASLGRGVVYRKILMAATFRNKSHQGLHLKMDWDDQRLRVVHERTSFQLLRMNVYFPSLFLSEFGDIV